MKLSDGGVELTGFDFINILWHQSSRGGYCLSREFLILADAPEALSRKLHT